MKQLPQISIRTDAAGNLLMRANKAAQRSIRQDLLKSDLSPKAQEAAFVVDYLGEGANSWIAGTPEYRQILPDDCGALTDATCICERRGWYHDRQSAEVWADMDYAVKNFLETLAEGGEVVWSKG